MLVVGSHVRLQGIKAKPELNGKEGVCVECQKDGRWKVAFVDNGVEFAFKPENLSVIKPNFEVFLDSCSMQGLRNTQEDRHVKVANFTKAARALKMPIDHLKQPCSFAAVYDGHCGQVCSDFAAKGFHMKLLKKLSADTKPSYWTDDRIEEALRTTTEELDNEFLSKYRTAKDGSTVVVALVVGERCFVSWAGDSRGIACRETLDGTCTVVPLSQDHRPTSESEAKRIVADGGEVVQLDDGCCRVAQKGYQDRVLEIIRAEQQGLGMIGKPPVAMAVSRSLGDRDFKTVTRGTNIISATPEIHVLRLDASIKFVVLMSDGITDAVADEETVILIDRYGSAGNEACKALVQEALARGSSDNVTAVLARFEWTNAGVDIAAGPPQKKLRTEVKLCNICKSATDERGECAECGVISG